MSKHQKSPDVKSGYYGYSSENVSSGSKSKKNKDEKSSSKKTGTAGKAVGIILFLIQLALSITFVALILSKGFAFITPSILTSIIAVLIVLLALVLFMLSKSKNVRNGGKAISVLVIIILAFLIYLIAFIDADKFATGEQLSDEPFVVFVSANDTFGTFDSNTIGRSDTNILAVVNPKQHNVLMVSTPRDYYVAVQAKAVAPESYDKLTHVGLYGKGTAKNSDGTEATASDWQWAYEVSWNPGNKALMSTLKSLYNIDIKNKNYHYVKLNFTGFAELIDAMGGITVNVDTPFSTTTYASYGDKDTGERKTYTYTKGKMEMDGATALTFARERHSFSNGDMQRNKNQVKVLKAIEKKALSGSTLLRYNSILNAIENSFATDIDISSSINLLKDGGTDGWNIMSFNVIGTPSREICTYTGTSLSVVLQDTDSVNRASDLIQMTLDGKTKKEITTKIKSYNKEQQ
jgi:LCP family protein required for cell wall assembly